MTGWEHKSLGRGREGGGINWWYFLIREQETDNISVTGGMMKGDFSASCECSVSSEALYRD